MQVTCGNGLSCQQACVTPCYPSNNPVLTDGDICTWLYNEPCNTGSAPPAGPTTTTTTTTTTTAAPVQQRCYRYGTDHVRN